MPIPSYNLISPNTVLRKALTHQTLSAGDACTPAKSPRTSKQSIMLTVPRAATTATPMLPLSPIGPESSSLYSSTKSKINGNFEMKHSTASTAPKNSLFHRVILQAKATRLYAYTGNLRALDRPILSQPLTTL
jgi:hypothetical protein